MADLHRSGGIPVVLDQLLDDGLLSGEILTVTGHTVAENLDNHDFPDPDGTVVRALDDPLYDRGRIVILTGNFAPDVAVIKVTGDYEFQFEGRARAFEDEYRAYDAVQRDEIDPGTVIVVRNEGPRGGPGMPSMLDITSAVVGG